MPERKPAVSDAELEVLKVLWTTGPGTVRDVEANMSRRRRKLAYNTILTLVLRARLPADRLSRPTHHPRSCGARRPRLRRHDEPARPRTGQGPTVAGGDRRPAAAAQ